MESVSQDQALLRGRESLIQVFEFFLANARLKRLQQVEANLAGQLLRKLQFCDRRIGNTHDIFLLSLTHSKFFGQVRKYSKDLRVDHRADEDNAADAKNFEDGAWRDLDSRKGEDRAIHHGEVLVERAPAR